MDGISGVIPTKTDKLHVVTEEIIEGNVLGRKVSPEGGQLGRVGW